jgi:hypothetical protein
MTKKRTSQGKKRKAISRGASNKQVRAGNGKSTGGKPIEGPEDPYFADAFCTEPRKRQKMQLKFEDGKLLITLPRIDPPQRSRSGKSHLIATTRGVKRTPLLVEGLPVYVVATAFVYGYGEPLEPPVRWIPLLEPPKSDEDDDQDEIEREWKTVPLLE